ncbi:MAG: ParB/RepB/Spo0J family partition protein [Geminicoccaceae bacterium]
MTILGEDSKSSGRRRGLGRGLSSLIPDLPAETDAPSTPGVKTVPIEFLKPSPLQPRQRFADDDIDGLADSIRAKGIMQPLLVRNVPEGGNSYEIIAGERRWRAAQRAGLHDLPVLVHDLSDRDTLEVALLENVQREDLSPLEEAQGYQRLIDDFGHTQQELSDIIGKSRSHIANLLRLLLLPAKVRSLLETGALSAGHARALINADKPADLAKIVVDQGLNVRQTEALVKREKDSFSSTKGLKSSHEKDPDTIALERELSTQLGMHVALKPRGKGGVVSISYRTLEQLDGLLRRLR